MLPQVEPELAQDVPQVRWRYDDVKALLGDPAFREAVMYTAHDKAQELSGIGDKLEGYTKDAFNEGFLKLLQGGPDEIAKTLMAIIDYTTDTGGGVGGHVEDDNAVDYYNVAKKRGALGTLTLPAKQRLVGHVLSGATIGEEDAMIVDLLSVNVADGVQIIKHFSWHWIWDDVDGEDCRNFIKKLGMRSGRRRALGAKTMEVSWLADGATSEIQEETIIVILETCSKSEVLAIEKAVGGLDWDLDGVEQDKFDAMKR